jgi:F0F1-type ATP synthase membrane subunit c/vacuolar-type H+-ATPase subunit K
VVLVGLGLRLGWPALAAAGLAVGVGTAAGLLREAVGLGRMLYDALQGVARRARLHYAPPLDARAVEGK